MTTPAGPPDRFRLLYVCTGNICRSPFAQFHTRFLLEARLGPADAARLHVASAGTGAVVGSGVHPLTRPHLTSRQDHPDVAAFRSRQLPDRDVLLSDLVLTVSRDHRGRVLQDVPQALSRTFTLREFVRLLEAADPAALRDLPADPVARARALVALALATRGTPPPVPAEEDAVPDPIGGESEDHAASARVIDQAVRAMVELLVPPRPSRPPPGPRPAWGPPGVPGPAFPGQPFPGHGPPPRGQPVPGAGVPWPPPPGGP